MRKIKSVDELPEWFDINAYDNADKLSALQWLREILFRIQEYEGFCDDGICKGLISNQIPENTTQGTHKKHEDPALTSSTSMKSVELLRLPFAYGIYLWADDDEKEIASNVINYDDWGDLSKDISYDEYIKSKGIDHDGDTLLSVNLHASDEQILNELKLLLPIIRKKLNELARKKIFDERDFLAWHNAAILPCYDLLKWADKNDLSIPLHVLGEAIFPSPNAGNKAERVRKTTKPLMLKIMTISTVQQLDTEI